MEIDEIDLADCREPLDIPAEIAKERGGVWHVPFHPEVQIGARALFSPRK